MKNIILVLVLLLSCGVHATDSPNYQQLATDLFQTYKQRQDFKAFLNFYADDMAFEDVFYQVNLHSKKDFADFYDWNKGKFERLNNPHILRVDSLVTDKAQVVARGEFLQFRYNGKEMGPWRFVIWLEFNQHGKVIKQIDWINYSQKNKTKGN